MKLLITGACGEVASGGLVSFLGKFFDLKLTDIVIPKEQPSVQNFYPCDLRDKKKVEKLVEDVDAIIHLASRGEPADLYEIFSSNVNSTLNLVDCAVRCGIGKFIFMSSVCVYGMPWDGINPLYLPIDEEHPLRAKDSYSVSKFAAENVLKLYAEQYGICVAALRLGAVIVNGKRNYDFRLSLLQNNKDYAAGGEYWNYIDVRDVGAAVKLILKSNLSGYETFNLTAQGHLLGNSVANNVLVKKFFRNTEVRKESFIKSCNSFYSIDKAKTILNFNPEFSKIPHGC